LFAAAESYANAAHCLAQSSPRQIHHVRLPLSFLFGMAFELGLKAAVLHCGATQADIFDRGHRLLELLDDAEARGFQALDKLRLRACLTVLADQHLDHSYRYLPIGTTLRTPRVGETVEVLAELMTALLRTIGKTIEFREGGA
jgi:hypothetical protein